MIKVDCKQYVKDSFIGAIDTVNQGNIYIYTHTHIHTLVLTVLTI